MAFCAKCGKALPEGATFCPSCGTPVARSGQATPSTTPTTGMTGIDSLLKDSKAQEYWVKRLVALIIDAIIVYIVLGILATIVALPFIFSAGFTGNFAPVGFVFGAFAFLWGILFVLYFTVIETSMGASIGKRLLSLKAVSKTGSNPTLGESFVRNLSKIHWLLLLLDVIVGLALAKGYHQKYSDYFMGTSVVPQ